MFLYLGDDDMSRAAAYLSGVMTYFNIPFERVDSSENPTEKLKKQYDGYILSDYPRNNFQTGQLEFLRDAVSQGAGLLMVGGWESFHGKNGEYHQSVLADVLPVTMLDKDDRQNFPQGALILKQHDHPVLNNLPWDKPPFIGGLNQFTPKPNTDLLLQAIRNDIQIVPENEIADGGLTEGDLLKKTPDRLSPLLVVGHYGKGKTAALATDVAPHWVGGFVDWGKERISVKLPNNAEIEVGADYAQFFAQLVQWIGM